MSDDSADRSTSHAKTVDLNHQKNTLARALKLKEEFDRANAAKENSLEQQQSRQEEKTGQASHAKTVDLNYEKNPLDRALKLNAEFNRGSAIKNSPEQQKSGQEEKARHLSHAPRPETHLKPPDGEIRREVDKKIDEEKLNKEHERAKALNEAYKEQQRGRQQQLENEKTNDRSR